MTEQDIRNKAAELARECRAIDRKGKWSIKEWNDQVRSTVRYYMDNIRRFINANQEAS